MTGCSSGIGLEIAKRLFAEKKYRAFVTARASSIHVLHQHFVENDQFLIRALDMTHTDEIRQVVEEMSLRFGRIDVVINNAGICYRSVMEHMDEKSEMEQIQTNYLGPAVLMRKVLPIMREQRSGKIINVSSLSGVIPMPTMGSYSASKHALEAVSEALWYEARPYGISIHCVQPGFVKSSSYTHVKLPNKARISEAMGGPQYELYLGMRPFIARMMRLAVAGPEVMARRILTLAQTKRAPLLMPLTFDAFVMILLRKILPLSWFNPLMFHLLPGSHQWGPQTDGAIRN